MYKYGLKEKLACDFLLINSGLPEYVISMNRNEAHQLQLLPTATISDKIR